MQPVESSYFFMVTTMVVSCSCEGLDSELSLQSFGGDRTVVVVVVDLRSASFELQAGSELHVSWWWACWP